MTPLLLACGRFLRNWYAAVGVDHDRKTLRARYSSGQLVLAGCVPEDVAPVEMPPPAPGRPAEPAVASRRRRRPIRRPIRRWSRCTPSRADGERTLPAIDVTAVPPRAAAQRGGLSDRRGAGHHRHRHARGRSSTSSRARAGRRATASPSAARASAGPAPASSPAAPVAALDAAAGDDRARPAPREVARRPARRGRATRSGRGRSTSTSAARDSGYRIHGTNTPKSIGWAASSGCFRMLNQDVIDLYDRVPMGAKVVVL